MNALSKIEFIHHKSWGFLDFLTLVLGVALLGVPALAQGFVSLFVITFWRNIDLLTWVNIGSSFWVLNLAIKFLGGILLATIVWRFISAKRKVDSKGIKRSLMRFGAYSLVLFFACSLFVFADLPISRAEYTATTGYVFDIPVSSYDWYIGRYTDGNYYAINGATWDNMVGGIGSTAWSAYTGNFTKLLDLVLKQISFGSVYLKDVFFDYSLADSIPPNVVVIENVNGVTRQFVNPASSQGSPYTISVHSDRYCAEDSKGRICWSSKDFISTFQNTLNAGGKIVFPDSSIFTINNTIIGTNNTSIEGNNATINIESNENLVGVFFDGVTNSTWKNLNIIRVGTTGTAFDVAVMVTGASSIEFISCNITNKVNSTGSSAEGVTIRDTASVMLTDCVVTGGNGNTAFGVGVYNYGYVSIRQSTLYATTPSSFALYMHERSQGTIENSLLNSLNWIAVRIREISSPTFFNTKIVGGLQISGSSTAFFSDCDIYGYSRGVATFDAATPTFLNCRIIANPFMANRYAVEIAHASSPKFEGCTFSYDTVHGYWSYSSVNNGRFAPWVESSQYKSVPYILEKSLMVQIYKANPGATLDIGSTPGGCDIASGIDLSKAGTFSVEFNRVAISAGGYMYATPNIPVKNRDFMIFYTIAANQVNSYAARVISEGQPSIINCVLRSNAASSTVFLNTTGLIMANSYLETLNPSMKYALTTDSVIENVNIYNCVFVGSVDEKICIANGKSIGSNIQI